MGPERGDDEPVVLQLGQPGDDDDADRAHRAHDDRERSAVRRVREDRECRIFVLRGAGETFCAGDDIKDFTTWQPDDPYWQVRL